MIYVMKVSILLYTLYVYLSLQTVGYEILLQSLTDIGFGRIAPSDGAFYLYSDISSQTNDSVSYCSELLDQTGVAMTPGVDFDPVNGRRSVRISFAGSTENIEEAARRITQSQQR